jgi:Putative prokaryotic signal transducing protein
MKPGQDAFVKLVTANGLTEADTWKAVLEASGIPVYLRHEALATVVPETAGEIAAVDLWVPRDQAAQAMEILQDERIEPGDEDELN